MKKKKLTFPENEKELEEFEALYGNEDYGLTGQEIDPDKIIRESSMSVGCKVQITLLDAEEGFPFATEGVITFDYEELYFRKEVRVRLDNGQSVDVPKWCLKAME
jgi:hypothetical protein